MPIVWGVDHAAHLVSATGKGVLGKEDIENYIDGLAAAATLSYRKVFRMDDCQLALSAADMMAIGARVRAYEVTRPMGKVALIAGSDELYEQARLFETLVAARRALRVFRQAEAAYDWLNDGLPEDVERAGIAQAAGRRPGIALVRD